MGGEKVNVVIQLEQQKLESFERLKLLLDQSEKKTKELKNATYALNKERNRGGSGSVKQKNRYNKALEEELATTKMVNIELRKQNQIYRQLRDAQKKANLEKKKAGALSRGLATAYFKIGAAIAVITGALRSFTKMRDTLIMLDSFRFAMSKITGSTEEAAEAFQFVTAMSDAYGISLAKTADRYVKFSTAAKQAGLSLFDTQNIYNSMSKASGVLGLKTHEVEGVFLALEQMLSKGKITTEELRRQLGERLPGAMGMMVTAYNRLHPEQEITLQQFDKLLKKGKVLSHEVLPEFAKVVEEELGINAVKGVDTLVASMVRADNAYTTMIADMEKGTGKLANLFKAFYKMLAEIWEDIGELFLTTDELDNKNFQLGFAKGRIRAAEELRKELSFFPDEDEETRKLRVMEELGRQYTAVQRRLLKAQEPVSIQWAEAFGFGGVWGTWSLQQKKRARLNAIKEIKQAQGEIVGAMRALNEDMKSVSPSPDDTDDTKNKPFFLPYVDPESKKGIEQAIKYIKEVRDELAPDDPLYVQLEKDLKVFQEYLAALEDFSGFLTNDIDLEGNPILDITPEIKGDAKAALRTFLEKAGLDAKDFDIDAMIAEFYETAGDDDSINALRKWFKRWLKDYGDELDDAKDKQDELTQEILRLSTQIASELFNIGGGILQARIENINAEIRAEEEKYDRLLELAEGDAEATKRLEMEKAARMKQLEKEELKARQKQAKLQKSQAIFDILANTAVAIIGIWRGWSSLGPLGVGPATTLTALVSALGAAQIASVAAAPIPKYASGRIGGREELAIVGDAGQREVIRKPDGTTYYTPNKPTLTMLGAGDSVYSSENAFKAQLEREILRGYNPDYDKIEDAILKGFKKAKINNTTRPVVKVVVKEDRDWLVKNSQF